VGPGANLLYCGGLGTKFPEAQAVCGNCLTLQTLTAKTIKIRSCGISLHYDSWPVWHFVGAKPPSPYTWIAPLLVAMHERFIFTSLSPQWPLIQHSETGVMM